MSNLSVNRPLSTPVAPATQQAQSKPAAEGGLKAPQKASSLSQDMTTWSTTAKSDRVKVAITETFKSTVIPSVIGGALAPAVAGAALGGFIGMFNGQVANTAKEGFVAGLKYAPHGAAAGLAIAGVDAAVVGTVVGTSPDKASAMTRLGTATAILGLLSAEDAIDVIGTGIDAAANSARAGKIFDKTNAALQK